MEELFRRLEKEMKVMQLMKKKEKEINAIIDSAMVLFDECDLFYKNMEAFAKVGPGKGVPAPIPSLESHRVNEKAIDQAGNSYRKIIKEAGELMGEMALFREQYFKYCKTSENYIDGISKATRKNKDKLDDIPGMVKSMNQSIGKMDSFNKQADQFLFTARKYKTRLQNIKEQLNTLKEVN